MSQVEVSKHLIVTPSNMTKMIDKLEKEGLVSRFSLKGDRRVNLIKVTKKAEVLLDNIWEQYCLELNKLMEGLTDQEKKLLSSHLIKWLNLLMDQEN